MLNHFETLNNEELETIKGGEIHLDRGKAYRNAAKGIPSTVDAGWSFLRGIGAGW